jgi:branched-chain amino acid aminotransferase
MQELKIWMNGRLVPQAEAVLPVNSAAVFYATNVFEGLRAYWNDADEELYCFRLLEHFTRFRESMRLAAIHLQRGSSPTSSQAPGCKRACKPTY